MANVATLDVATLIKQVRAVEARIKQIEQEYDDKIAPFEEFVKTARATLLQYLNDTKQKSAATVEGTAYWKPKITFRVVDKDAFRRHIIGAEAWELLTWAAAGVAAEDFTIQHNEPPPGVERSSINILYINAPPKPRKRKAATTAAPPLEGEQEMVEDTSEDGGPQDEPQEQVTQAE
jgi:hypothetical protein